MAMDTVKLMQFRRAWQVAAAVYRADDLDSAEYRRVWNDFACIIGEPDALVFILRSARIKLRTFKEQRERDAIPS